MFRLSVLQNQWLIMALASGLIIMLGVCDDVPYDVAVEERIC